MATQEEVRELAQRLEDAAEGQRLQAQQILELQRQAQQGAQAPVGVVSATAGSEFGVNRTIDTRVL